MIHQAILWELTFEIQCPCSLYGFDFRYLYNPFIGTNLILDYT